MGLEGLPIVSLDGVARNERQTLEIRRVGSGLGVNLRGTVSAGGTLPAQTRETETVTRDRPLEGPRRRG